MTLPEKLKLTFGCWDRSDRIANPIVANRCRSLTRFYLKSCFPHAPIFENTDVDKILRTAAQTDAKWCLVQAYGHIVMRYEFYLELEKVLLEQRSEFLVMGHILDRKEGYFELHHQCFLVNLDVYRRLDRPKFGGDELGERMLPQPIRSSENFHDDYTPPWLHSGNGAMNSFVRVSDGHSFIAASMFANLGVPGFPPSLRDRKHFLYPEAATERFEAVLRNPDLEPTAELNESQFRFISGMRQNWFWCRNSVFLFNTDDIRNVRRLTAPGENVGTLYSVASGFRPVKLLCQNGYTSNTSVVYFDYSEAAIEFRKRMNRDFDGENFVDFIRTLSNNYIWGHYQARTRTAPAVNRGDGKFAETFVEHPNLEAMSDLWKTTQEAFGGPAEFRRIWNETRKLKTTYLHVDLFETPSELTDYIQKDTNDPILIWWSNSFATESTRTFLPESEIETAYSNFEFTLKGRRLKTLADGFSPSNFLLTGNMST